MGRTRKDSYFIVVDGIEGAGKGVAICTIKEFFREIMPPCDSTLNLDNYWEKFGTHPQFQEKYSKKGEYQFDYLDLDDFKLVVASEPTYTDAGNTIRNEIIATRNKGKYSAKFTAEMYSADRLILYQRVLIPALNDGKIWVQSRSFSTSIVYQRLQAAESGENLSLNEILSLAGNTLAMQNPPNLLIIPTIKDVEKALERTRRREKDDQAIFETLDFQLKVKPHYESAEFREFFEKIGTKVEYVDGGAEFGEYRQQIKAVLERNDVKKMCGLDKIVKY